MKTRTKLPKGYLVMAPVLGKGAARMLTDFVNTRPEKAAYLRFLSRWDPKEEQWRGNEGEFRTVQEKIRAIWERREGSLPNLHLNQYLGFAARPEDQKPRQPIFEADWRNGVIRMDVQKLNEWLWVALLQFSRMLGICENHKRFQDCPTPYFIKYRPNARFCGQECAVTAKREAKRRWWEKHRSQAALEGKKAK